MPAWIRARRLQLGELHSIKKRMRTGGLHTVCEEARCPNAHECWAGGTATVMLLGEVCTRGCRFCAVESAARPPDPDPGEPEQAAEAVAELLAMSTPPESRTARPISPTS